MWSGWHYLAKVPRYRNSFAPLSCPFHICPTLVHLWPGRHYLAIAAHTNSFAPLSCPFHICLLHSKSPRSKSPHAVHRAPTKQEGLGSNQPKGLWHKGLHLLKSRTRRADQHQKIEGRANTSQQQQINKEQSRRQHLLHLLQQP